MWGGEVTRRGSGGHHDVAGATTRGEHDVGWRVHCAKKNEKKNKVKKVLIFGDSDAG